MGQKVIMFARLLLHCARLFSRISTHCFQRWKKTDFAQPCQHRGKGVVNSANLISMKCNLRTVLICISLITNQPNYFPSICLLSAYPPGWSTGPHPSPAYLLEASLIHLNEHFRANKSNHLPARPSEREGAWPQDTLGRFIWGRVEESGLGDRDSCPQVGRRGSIPEQGPDHLRGTGTHTRVRVLRLGAEVPCIVPHDAPRAPWRIRGLRRTERPGKGTVCAVQMRRVCGPRGNTR